MGLAEFGPEDDMVTKQLQSLCGSSTLVDSSTSQGSDACTDSDVCSDSARETSVGRSLDTLDCADVKSYVVKLQWDKRTQSYVYTWE